MVKATKAAARLPVGFTGADAPQMWPRPPGAPRPERLEAPLEGGFEANVPARALQELTRIVLSSEVPVVAALNGISVGGAAELTLACDARVGFAGSDYLFPENEVGLTISNGSSALLTLGSTLESFRTRSSDFRA